ncbi:MAG TPA: sigma-54 dependent transcriptional regulator [Nitrospiraceae bacterium]|nr:sigma-54 dependent transcriptional regulator [Nitrospiraceae bacterium]
MKGLKLLIIDDEPLMRLSMMDALAGVGCEVAAASTGTEGIHILGQRQFDVVITDLRLPGADGLAVLKACKERNPNTEVILITAHGSVDTAMGAMKLGAYDYITKPFQMEELLLIVERVGKMFTLRRDTADVEEASEDRVGFGGLIGRNTRMRAVLERIRAIAAGHSSVLIEGESGTGKELVANALHMNSARKDFALVKVTCGTLPEDRFESEVFGHEKGAFPGAVRLRRGRVELASRGTLFLDEIDESPPGVQAKLLRLVRERRFERTGGTDMLEVDVRLVCATRKDLEKEASAGRFNRELFNQLSEARIMVPALRERPEDILMIAESLAQVCGTKLHKNVKGFSPTAGDLLPRYSFPGNVRELKQMVERAAARVQDGEPIQSWDLCGNQSCPYLGGTPQENCGFCREGLTVDTVGLRASSAMPRASLAEAREQFERSYIMAALDQAQGNAAEAGHTLGLSTKALREKCADYGIPLHPTIEPETDGA